MKISTLVRLLEDINSNESKLTDWERHFASSIDSQAHRQIRLESPTIALTRRQEQTLWKLHSKATGV